MTEEHLTNRIGWLRASVLGANDGILSTAGILIGVGAASSTRSNVLVAGVASLVAGAFSMAAGEYVSVSSQADTESADIEREKLELESDPEGELKELAGIYRDRGLDANLALEVAQQLTEAGALEAHARDELGISEAAAAKPVQAALASAASFAAGALLPLITAALAPDNGREIIVALLSLAFLALLGAIGAKTGGAPMARGAIRVMFWGTVAMIFTFVIGRAFGAAV